MRHLLIVVGITALSVLSVQLFSQTKDALAEQQDYDIICLVHRPTDTLQSSINELVKFGLTENEASTIHKQDISGTFWTDTFFRVSKSKMISTDFPNYNFDSRGDTPGGDIEFMFGNKLDSTMNLNSNKIIIIMNHPLEEGFEFNEPLNSSLILIQELNGNGFKSIPLGEEVNSKIITIKKTDFRSFPYSTSIMLDLKGRGEFRLHGFQWLKK
ncbi:hypothetical protein [Lutimonas sp.]|uniref:hypothetical protein n=1 Tax=Lutimonas sp. TaxID=1872403 RepID=UPI003D9BECEF